MTIFGTAVHSQLFISVIAILVLINQHLAATNAVKANTWLELLCNGAGVLLNAIQGNSGTPPSASAPVSTATPSA